MSNETGDLSPANRPNTPSPQAQPGEAASESAGYRLELREYSGILPDPVTLLQYQQIYPEAVERLFALAEKTQTHRMEMEVRVVRSNIRSQFAGQFLAFLVAMTGLGVAAYGFHVGFPTAAATLACSVVGALAGVFYLRQREPAPDSGSRPDGD